MDECSGQLGRDSVDKKGVRSKRRNDNSKLIILRN